MEFEAFQKIARLSRECTITEKIDGSNGCVSVRLADADDFSPGIDIQHGDYRIRAGSRSKWISPQDDNFGFARWVHANAQELSRLGEGRHFGEWWGSGIQRRYGLTEKRFSLFNTAKWSDPAVRPTCCHVVPVLFNGLFSSMEAESALHALAKAGSYAAPGFMKPEGIIIYHHAANLYFKKTLEKDEEWKGKQAA